MVPIIALTANAIAGNDELFLHNGFQAFLSKPIDIKQLNAAINTWVRDRVYEREHAAELAALEASAQTAQADKGGAASGAPPEFPDIPGLDLSGALERFGNWEGLLVSLHSYITHTPGLLEELRAAPPDRYAITVHGIKGASRGIAANAVGDQAEALEKAAKTGDSAFVAAHTADFIAAAEALIANLQKALDTAENREAKPLREKPDPELLKRISAAAADYNISALDTALEELEQYRYVAQEDLCAWLRDRVERSEFEEIRCRLDGQDKGHFIDDIPGSGC
jgi:CheY-like chemotaxis protein